MCVKDKICKNSVETLQETETITKQAEAEETGGREEKCSIEQRGR